jgi:plastocyanin
VARSKRILLGILLGAGLLLVPVAGTPFVAAGNPCFHGFETPTLTVASATSVRTQPCAFEPTVTVVKTGDTVTFRNDGDMPHLVTGANGEWGDREIELAPGKTAEYTFAEPGVYPYMCAFHPGMTGAIVVGDGGPALAAAVAAAGGGGGGASTDQGGSGTPSGTAAPAATLTQPDPIVVAAVAALVGAALALAVVALAARSRDSRAAPAAETPAAGTSAEPLR